MRRVAWVFVVAAVGWYAWHIAGIGLDLREDFWDLSSRNHAGFGDVQNAMARSNAVLREAGKIADEDNRQKSPAQQQYEAEQTAAGHPPASLTHPGPGLFDGPVNSKIFIERWNHLRPVYRQILRGWVANYENLQNSIGDDGNYGLDYPPLRLLVMTLWTWHVHTNYFGLNNFPRMPRRIMSTGSDQSVVATMDIVQPLLKLNAFCEGVSAIAVLILVWLWVGRSPKRDRSRLGKWLLGPRNPPANLLGNSIWQDRWGDPALLIPVTVFGICTLFRSNFTWQMPMLDTTDLSPIDVRVASAGWWMFLLLRFVSAVCLARFLPRPFRGPMCGLVAATMVWLNPAGILDSFGFPQWDSWLPPFFLLAAVLVTLDWWIAAGLLLGVGCMFKGQLLFVSPVLVLCPLLAGWPGRFLRIIAGLCAGAGLVVWPWLVTNLRAQHWIIFACAAGAFFCAVSSFRSVIWRRSVAFARAAWREYHSLIVKRYPLSSRTNLSLTLIVLLAIVSLTVGAYLQRGIPSPGIFLGIAIAVVPWFLPRRMLGAWLLFVFASALWLAAVELDGAWSWWKIGFLFGTKKHQVMQLGSQSLSNLSSILGERYGWSLHDPITTLTLPWLGSIDLDLRDFLATIYFTAMALCAIAAASHLRRRDPRFLIALVAPWALFPVILTQMAARYPMLPAVVGSSLVAVSVEMSLLAFVQTVLACIMLGNQLMLANDSMAPVTFSITQPTHPDIAWAMMLLTATIFLAAMMPSRRWRTQAELL